MAQLTPDSDYARPNLKDFAGGAPDLEMPALTDVEGQFLRITRQGDDLIAVDSTAFTGDREYRYTGEETAGNLGKNHFQGVLRRGQYLFLSGGDGTEPVSHVFVLRLATRPERGPWGSNVRFRATPAEADGIVRVVALEAEHWHAGGLGLLGEVLGVPLEGDEDVNGRVVFLDVRDPLTPTRLPVTIERDNPKASAVALARLPGGRILCGVWWDAQGAAPHGRLDVYLSRSDNLLDGFLPRPCVVTWQELFEHRDPSYQAVAFLLRADAAPAADGSIPLYVIGTENGAVAAPTQNGTNWGDLCAARVTPWTEGMDPAPSCFTLELLKPLDFHCVRQQGNFDAAAGVYVDPSGTLSIYSAYHWRYDGDIHLTEFHGLPAPDTTVVAAEDGWIELYAGPDFDGRCLGIFGTAESGIPDYARIYVQGGDFDAAVGSLRFQIPVGSMYRLFRAPGYQGTRPGIDFFDLVGTGRCVEIPDLRADAYRFAVPLRSSRYVP